MGQDLILNGWAFALQVLVITASAAALLSVVRIASAGVRYGCWRVVLAACLVMPLVLQRPAPGTDHRPSTAFRFVDISNSDIATDLVAPPADPTPEQIPWTSLGLLVITAGIAARLCWLVVGLIRLGTLRRRGAVVVDDDYAEIQAGLGTTAMLRSVEGLTQPATFGLFRPVVLLPEMLRDSPAAFRRAVVTHELFHVRRHDWVWVLAEEIVRAALWFHPAILWLTSRIQLAREELVDELTVLATGDRRAYIEALLTFADAGCVAPAPAFARRRQLFTRIVRLSKEGVMSSPRIIVSASFVIAFVLGTGLYAGHAFPIVSAAGGLPVAPVLATEVQRPSVDSSKFVGISAQPRQQLQGARSGGAPRPGPAVASTPASGTKPITPENPIPRRLASTAALYPGQLRGSGVRGVVSLQVTLDASGAISNVRRMAVEVGGGDATDSSARRQAVEAFFTAASDAVRQWRYQAPADPPIAFYISVRFEPDREAVATQGQDPIAQAGQGLTVTATFAPTAQSIASATMRLEELKLQERQLRERLGSQHPEVMKVRQQIQDMERELERARDLEQRADELRQPAQVLRTAGQTGVATRTDAVRVGGNIRPPQKTKHVDPVYPPIAQSARVQGVVILETIIDEQGRVADARVLRSIPLLDQAALDAVRQWEFSPTMLNGVPTPVIMTTTVQFSLPPQ